MKQTAWRVLGPYDMNAADWSFTRIESMHGSDKWNLANHVIDTVFYDADCDRDYVLRGLIDHDGYPSDIRIAREALCTNWHADAEEEEECERCQEIREDERKDRITDLCVKLRKQECRDLLIQADSLHGVVDLVNCLQDEVRRLGHHGRIEESTIQEKIAERTERIP